MNYTPSIDYIKSRLSVDVEAGKAYWIDATKHHIPLIGKEAGSIRRGSSNHKKYWHIKIDGTPIKRSRIVFAVANGFWPDEIVDHINGDSLDDRIENLRSATTTQNAWNHKSRAKQSDLPMGIRRLPSGRYQARIACNKKFHSLGSFETSAEAVDVYQQKRKEMFGDYA